MWINTYFFEHCAIPDLSYGNLLATHIFHKKHFQMIGENKILYAKLRL